jgi:anti-sigma B factor antagonist
MGVLAMTLEIESGPEIFHVDVAQREGTVILSLAGELDVSGAVVLREEFFAAVASEDAVECHLEHLTYLDSTGISLLISVQKRLRSTGREMVLVAPTERVNKVLEITGVTSYFTIRDR